MYKVGGWFSILSSFCNLVLGILVLVQPVVFQENNVELFLGALEKDPLCILLYYLIMSAYGLCGIGVVRQLTQRMDLGDSEMIKWSEKMAYVGFAVLTISYFKAFATKPAMADFYFGSIENAKNIVLGVDSFALLAPKGLATYLLIGFWVLCVSVVSMKKNSGPKVHNIVGILLGAVLLGVVVPEPGPIGSIFLGTARGTLAFLWFGMMGLHMLREKNHMKTASVLRSLD